jgi:TetR/AcrR family transcriptional regulator
MDSISPTEQRIFNAASDVFEEKGYTGARMQEIANRAGINKALLHYYFRTKEQLFRGVFQVLLKKMFEKIFSIFTEEIPFKEKIKILLDEHIEFMIRNPKLPIFLLNELSQNPALAEGIKEMMNYQQLRDIIYTRHAKELKGYGIKKSDMPQLMVTVVSLSIFPVAAREMIKIMMPEIEDNKKFNAFMRERKTFASNFVIAALKHNKK